MLDEDFFSLGHDVDVQLDDVARVDVDRSAEDSLVQRLLDVARRLQSVQVSQLDTEVADQCRCRRVRPVRCSHVRVQAVRLLCAVVAWTEN